MHLHQYIRPIPYELTPLLPDDVECSHLS